MIRIIKNLLNHKTFNTNQYVFMVSGGVDSIAASHFFFNNIKYRSLKTIFHCNHNNRSQNFTMQETVEEYSKTFDRNINYITYTSPVTKEKSEQECRTVRLDAVDCLFKNSIIITAHHLDDCVESYLLNCIRGKEGFLPIPFITYTKHNVLVHPFLFTTKKDLIKYSKDNNLMQYVVADDTNHITKGSRRNMIRNKILPVLENEQVGLRTIVKKKIENKLLKLIYAKR
jgi:tRNA(Ile)-lysidine synthetase-like protein